MNVTCFSRNKIFVMIAFLFLFLVSGLQAQTEAIEKILNPDGTIQAGKNGSYSVTGYTLEKGVNGEPMLKKNAETAQNNSNVTWSSLGTGRAGASNAVTAIAVIGTDVYFGGNFTAVEDVPANYIVKWNGSTWSALGHGYSNGFNNPVTSLAVIGTDLYVGGIFSYLGDGTSANRLAKWSTTTNSWSVLPSGSSNVYRKESQEKKISYKEFLGKIQSLAFGFTMPRR